MEVYIFTVDCCILYACASFEAADKWLEDNKSKDWDRVDYRYHNCEPFKRYKTSQKE